MTLGSTGVELFSSRFSFAEIDRIIPQTGSLRFARQGRILEGSVCGKGQPKK